MKNRKITFEDYYQRLIQRRKYLQDLINRARLETVKFSLEAQLFEVDIAISTIEKIILYNITGGYEKDA